MNHQDSSGRVGLTRRQMCMLPLAAGLSGVLQAAPPEKSFRPYVLLLGAPASGKTNHAGKLSEHYGVPAIFSHKVMERHIADRTRVTALEDARTQMERMQQTLQDLREEKLVADSALNAIVTNRLRQGDCAEGFALDGYPNTIEQANFFDAFISGGAVHPHLDLDQLSVIYLDIPDEEAMRRMKIRGRQDDRWKFASERLKVFRSNIGALLDHYKGPHFFRIDTTPPEDEVAATIRQFLEKRYSS